MHTVIVGGGFAGIKAALEISERQLGKITLISDQPYFLHHATLYATATGRSVRESVVSLEDIFADHHDVDIVHDTMTSIDGDKHTVTGERKKYTYDNLIIAIGVVTTYFGINGMADHSYGIKTLNDVEAFKDHIKSEVLDDKKLDKNYIVVGAGPTGVELAGALQAYLGELADSHMIKKGKINITLVEAAPKILPRSSDTASRKVQKRLESLGVKVLVNHKVEALDDDTIIIDGEKVPTKTAVWTSGVANNPFFAQFPKYFTLMDKGPKAVVVDDYMQSYPDVYVIGDNAAVQNAGVAGTAFRSAQFIADHLARKITLRPLKKYNYPKPAESFPIGDDWAYTEWRGIYAAGKVGYLLRRHIERQNYLALLPRPQAIAAWKAHNVRESFD
jgi:NADH:ubiquinone reductase (H+-translocating)